MRSDEERIRNKIASPVISRLGSALPFSLLRRPKGSAAHAFSVCAAKTTDVWCYLRPIALRRRFPHFLLLDSIEVGTLMAKRNGRAEPAIHGCDPPIDGSLRATAACLRISNGAVTVRANLVRPNDQCVCIDSETP